MTIARHLLQDLHIAVTRPVEQGNGLCQLIQHHGGVAILFPLIAVSPLQDYHAFEEQISQLETTDWAIFISSNAVDFALPHVLKKYGHVPENLRFAAIGHQTAQALARFGVREVLTPHTRFDSETLLALPEMQAVVDKKIAIFRGVGGRELMAETLKARGANVYFAESYQRINPQANTQLLHDAWQRGELNAVVVTSSEAMRNLLQMAEHSLWIRHVTLCVNHARIADLPRQQGLKVLLAQAPGDDAMLECLSTLTQHHD
ncbi:MAG: uroporphyrinogen-III synthase [Methylotenera sp.]|nr:uroporphyrinogen-III synthase [Methylotenera sp.]